MNPQRKQGISPRAASPAALRLRARLPKITLAEKKTDAQKIGGGILRTCSFPRVFEDAQK
jgi:hypothetical protein